jgi:gamma-glutamyltranspeptidase/glutathione hydrolase
MSLKPVISGRRFAIAAGHPLASMAGAEVLRSGGNAIDAGVAAGIALSVLESTLVSFAGVAPIIIRSAETEEIVTISGLGPWPKAVTPDYFNRVHGGRIPPGILRTVVPAAPDAWITALARYGTMGFSDVATFAVDYAENGFRTYDFMAELIETQQEQFARFPSTREIYLPGGSPPDIGSLFFQPALAATIRFMADEDNAAAARSGREAGLAAARAAFYTGDIAHSMASFIEAQGGLLRLEDLRDFSVGVEPTYAVQFGEWQVHGCGPWSQGPMLLQILKIAEGYDLKGLGHNSADYLHVLCEAIKLAAADRDAYYGDPQFVDVPMDILLSDEHAAKQRSRINMEHVAAGGRGDPRSAPDPRPDGASMDTTYVCVVDHKGNIFSATPSDASYNAPVVPDLGFVVSPRGSQSWADVSHPSSVAPGKRPRLTPNPALAVHPDGRLIPFGSPGGDVQTQAMAQCLINYLVFGFDIQTATEVPRFSSYDFPSSFEPHDRQPGVMRIERSLEVELGNALTARGHLVQQWPDLTWLAGSVSMIDYDLRSGLFEAGADPRRSAYAIGW